MAKSRWCEHCRRQVLAQYQWPQTFKHALLLMLSCGLYLPFWLYAMTRSRYRCSRCGTFV